MGLTTVQRYCAACDQLIQFSANNVTNRHHLTSPKVRCVAPQHRDRIVTTGYSDVTPPYPYILNAVRCPLSVRLSVTVGVASSVANLSLIHI